MSLSQINKYRKIVFLLFSILLLSFSNIYSQALPTQHIDADITLAVCGNQDLEYGEECEPLIFQPFSCTLLGYEGESVLCDSSCSLDLSACIIPDPPPPPIVDDELPEEESIEKYIPKTRTPITQAYILPFLEYFDLNGNGRIDPNEFTSSVLLWGRYWKEYREPSIEVSTLKCDLNSDNRCDIVDLSILLYYSK